MNFCKNCGAKLTEGSLFCPNCGASVENAGAGIQGSSNAVANIRRHNVQERSIVVAIILTILTCGIYSIYWMVKLNDEMLEVSNEEGASGLLVFVLTLLTCGIYGFFWYYKMGKCVDKIKGTNGEVGTGLLYVILGVILSFVGLGIVVYALIQDAINDEIRKHA